MAIYHFSAKLISRSRGRSATAAAAYRAGLDIADERTGEHHKYAKRTGVLDHAILTPARAPEWTQDSALLWNAVEQFEKRKDAQLCREIVVALPHELSLEQNRELLHSYVQDAYVKRGMAAQIDIHAPDHGGDKRNLHAHILLTTRQVTRNGFKEKKARSWNTKETLVTWRKQWADHVNQALERAGHKERVDHRSFKDLGIEDREATRHLGPQATQMERRGQETRIGNENRAAQAFNKLNKQAKVIDLQIEKENRRLATPSMQKAYKRAAGQKERVGKAIEVERPRSANDNSRRAELQSRHLDEQIKLERAQDRRLWEHEEQLAEYYSAIPDHLELSALKRQERLSRLDRERMEELRLNIANADRRAQEYREAFSSQQAQERVQLLAQQAREREHLERVLSGQVQEQRTVQAHTKERTPEPQGPLQGRERSR